MSNEYLYSFIFLKMARCELQLDFLQNLIKQFSRNWVPGMPGTEFPSSVCDNSSVGICYE